MLFFSRVFRWGKQTVRFIKLLYKNTATFSTNGYLFISQIYSQTILMLTESLH